MKSTEAGWCLRVHPVFLILCFIVLSLSLVTASVAQLIFAALLLNVLFFASGWQAFITAMATVYRLRWLLLSIFVIYGWLTPGPAVFGFDDVPGLPSMPGLIEGGRRLLILMLIVLAAQWLLWAIPKDRLVAALYWLAKPFAVLGMCRKRLAVRMALVLEMVPGVQLTIREQLANQTVRKGDIKAYAQVLVEVVSAVIGQAENEPLGETEIDLSDSPPLFQCLWPVALALLMLLLGGLSLPFSGQ